MERRAVSHPHHRCTVPNGAHPCVVTLHTLISSRFLSCTPFSYLIATFSHIMLGFYLAPFHAFSLLLLCRISFLAENIGSVSASRYTNSIKVEVMCPNYHCAIRDCGQPGLPPCCAGFLIPPTEDPYYDYTNSSFLCDTLHSCRFHSVFPRVDFD